MGYIYDRPAEWVLLPFAKKLHISFDPSPSRWGFFAVFFAWGLFYLSLFYTMPQTPDRGDIMWIFWLGIALIATAVYIGVYFLRHQDRDPSNKQLADIKQGITDINTKLDRTNKLLEQLIEKLDKWSGQ